MDIIEAVLVGGGLADGFPTKVNADAQIVRFPIDDETIRIFSMPDSIEKIKAWGRSKPLLEKDAKYVAIYVRDNEVPSTFDEETGGQFGITRVYFRFQGNVPPSS